MFRTASRPLLLAALLAPPCRYPGLGRQLAAVARAERRRRQRRNRPSPQVVQRFRRTLEGRPRRPRLQFARRVRRGRLRHHPGRGRLLSAEVRRRLRPAGVEREGGKRRHAAGADRQEGRRTTPPPEVSPAAKPGQPDAGGRRRSRDRPLRRRRSGGLRLRRQATLASEPPGRLRHLHHLVGPRQQPDPLQRFRHQRLYAGFALRRAGRRLRKLSGRPRQANRRTEMEDARKTKSQAEEGDAYTTPVCGGKAAARNWS